MAKIGMLTRQKRRQEEAPTHEFEVRCFACDVSFPPGTRRCMYCGNRPGAQPLVTPSIHPEPLEDYGTFGDFAAPGDAAPTEARGSQWSTDEQEQEVESPRGMLVRMLGSLSWVILFIAITVYRSCNG